MMSIQNVGSNLDDERFMRVPGIWAQLMYLVRSKGLYNDFNWLTNTELIRYLR